MEFPIRVSRDYHPWFSSHLPTNTFIRGPISVWAWEAKPWGTRLMIPTELTWRAYLLGPVLHKFPWATPRITGAAGVDAYRNPTNWFMAYSIEPDILFELRGGIIQTILWRKGEPWALHAKS